MKRRIIGLCVITLGCGVQPESPPPPESQHLPASLQAATLTVVGSGLTVEGRGSLVSVYPEEGATCAMVNHVSFESHDGVVVVDLRSGSGRTALPTITDGAEATLYGRYIWPDGSPGSPGDGFVELERVGDEARIRVETTTRCFDEEIEPGVRQYRCEAAPLVEEFRILVAGSSLECPRGAVDTQVGVPAYEGLCTGGGWCLGSPPSWVGEAQD